MNWDKNFLVIQKNKKIKKIGFQTKMFNSITQWSGWMNDYLAEEAKSSFKIQKWMKFWKTQVLNKYSLLHRLLLRMVVATEILSLLENQLFQFLFRQVVQFHIVSERLFAERLKKSH